MFGENLTLEGVSEDTVHIGDRFAVGSATLVVTQPRLPCYKLGIKFQSDAMVKRFLASGRTGFYFAVESEGAVAAGDPVAIVERESHEVPVSEIVRLYVAKKFNDADVCVSAEGAACRGAHGELEGALPAAAGALSAADRSLSDRRQNLRNAIADRGQ